MNEPTYQIFKARFDWSQAMDPERDHDLKGRWIEGLPPGRKWNGMDHFRMPKEETALEQMEAEAAEWFKDYLVRKPQTGIGDIKVKVDFVRRETWCLSWFSHFTWDIGQDNGEVLASFNRFVIRMEDLNHREGKMVDGLWREPYCLMGAEERDRWFGWTGTGDRGSKQTEAPCRCASCKRDRVIRINH